MAIKKPKIFPTFDFEDHIPTNIPSDLTLKWCPKIVKVAGKKLNWKKPNATTDTIIKKCTKMDVSYLKTPYLSYLNRDNNGIKLKPMTVGIAVYKQASIGFWLFRIE